MEALLPVVIGSNPARAQKHKTNVENKGNMSVCLLVHTDGTRERVVWEQCEVAKRLGGAISFVGAIDALRVVAVGLANAPVAHGPNALARTHPHVFHDMDVRGPIIFVGSDDDGDEMDVDVAALHASLARAGT